MKIVVVLNGVALHKKYFQQKILPALSAAFDTTVVETKTKDDAARFAADAATQGTSLVLAAGGDGTVHQVVNGLLSTGLATLPILGVIPLGSGNDFARTFNLSKDSESILSAIRRFRTSLIDVGKIRYIDEQTSKEKSSWFINEADIGMGPEVVKKVASGKNPFGPGAAYYIGILSTFLSFKPYEVEVKTPGWNHIGKIRTLAIANGKFYGHGLCIAPDAKPDDGKFATFICGNVSALDFIRFSGDLKKGKHIRLKEIRYDQAQKVELSCKEIRPVEADGELLGILPVTIEMLPGKLSLLL